MMTRGSGARSGGATSGARGAATAVPPADGMLPHLAAQPLAAVLWLPILPAAAALLQLYTWKPLLQLTPCVGCAIAGRNRTLAVCLPLPAPQPVRWSADEEGELVHLVKIHGRGSWAMIEKQGQAKFEGRRSQVRADCGACGAWLGANWSTAAAQHHFGRMLTASLPHPACT